MIDDPRWHRIYNDPELYTRFMTWLVHLSADRLEWSAGLYHFITMDDRLIPVHPSRILNFIRKLKEGESLTLDMLPILVERGINSILQGTTFEFEKLDTEAFQDIKWWFDTTASIQAEGIR